MQGSEGTLVLVPHAETGYRIQLQKSLFPHAIELKNIKTS